MRCLAWIVAVASAAVPARAVAQFEGVVTSDYRTNGGKQAFRTVQYYKGDRLRSEPQLKDAKGAYSIVDEARRQLISVTPERGTYITVDLKPAERLPHLKPTGRKETIAGHACEHYAITKADTPTDVADLCIAKGLGYSGYVGGRGTDGAGDLPDLRALSTLHAAVGKDPAWQALMKGGAFALSTTRTDGGVVRFQSKVTRIEPKKLAAALFVPPSDFKGSSLGDLNKMMKASPEP
jgi:hypothetical protein